MAYDYPTAFSCWGREEREAIDRVCNSGQYTMGPEVEAFEAEFAAWHGRRHGIMVNSGSSANLVAVAALFYVDDTLQRGDGAMVPALAWSTTYAPLVQYGFTLHLVDCDDTWNAVRYSKMTPSVFVACSVLGNAAMLERIVDEAINAQAWVIEDNCESLGAVTEYGTKTGTVGIASTFSFFYSHQISAIEGGMILTDDSKFASICRQLRAHGWTRDTKKPASFDEEYNFTVMGYNVRPVEMHAAIAREQLKKLDGFIEARRRNLDLFRDMTADLGIEHQHVRGQPSPFGMAFRVRDNGTRAILAAALRAAGIDCRLPTGGSFGRHQYGVMWSNQITPRADLVHNTGMFLGNAPFDIAPQIERAVKVMRATL